MTLEEAFYKQKDELHALQRENRKLKKDLDALRETTNKGIASDEAFQKQLSKIRGLSNKVSQMTGVADRYKSMLEQEKKRNRELYEKNLDLEIENEELRRQVEILSSDDPSKEATPELRDAEAQITALKEEVARLTARINNDGTNTGTPTSKTPIDKPKINPNSRVKTGRKKGGQPGHEKHEMAPFSEDEITDREDHTMTECPHCGSHNLEEIDEQFKDEYDYEVKVIKRRHRFPRYRCLDCGKIIQQPLGPLVAQNQYGSTVQAMALSLMNIGYVSVSRTRRILTGFTTDDITLCEGYLIKLQKRYSRKLTRFVADVKNHIVGLPLLYWDDTVIFIDTKRACLRFYGNETLALYTAHMQKNLDGLIEDNILPALSTATTVMHDHNTINYHDGFVFRNVECLQHLERDLQKLSEISGHSWAARLKTLIQTRIHERKGLIADGVTAYSKDELYRILADIDTILDDGYKEYINDLGHYFESDERALLNRLEAYKENYFEWIKDFEIPTSNNLSERSLRGSKTKQKVSGQFQSVEYASYFADIRTYLETCLRNGVNEFVALLRLTSGTPFTVNELLGEA